MRASPLRFSAFLASLGVVLVACSSDGSGDPTPEEASEALARAACTEITACSEVLFQTLYPDLETCVSRNRAVFLASFGSPNAKLDPAGVIACAKAYEGLACKAFPNNAPEACRSLVGIAPNGTRCAGGSECESGLCKRAEDAACGTCAAPVTAGNPCERANDCTPGLLCANERCVVAGALGSACSETGQCQLGLACKANVCAAPTVAPGACAETGECDTLKGEACDDQLKACRPVGAAAKAGEPCGIVPGTSGLVYCTGRSTCGDLSKDFLGTCKPPADDGQACSVDGKAGPLCKEPSKCVGGLCVSPVPSSCVSP